jgi:hypothetical protein
VYDGFTVGDVITLLHNNPKMEWFPVVEVVNRDYVMPATVSDASSPSQSPHVPAK